MKNFCERLAMRATIDDAERQRQDDDERQDPADRQHHDDDADQRQHRRQQLRQVLLQRAADAVEVVDRAAHHFAARSRVEELQRQPIELGLDLPAHARRRSSARRWPSGTASGTERRWPTTYRPIRPEQDAADVVEVDRGARARRSAFATNPSKIFVVARPRIFGPSTLKTVPIAPATTTTTSAPAGAAAGSRAGGRACP